MLCCYSNTYEWSRLKMAPTKTSAQFFFVRVFSPHGVHSQLLTDNARGLAWCSFFSLHFSLSIDKKENKWKMIWLTTYAKNHHFVVPLSALSTHPGLWTCYNTKVVEDVLHLVPSFVMENDQTRWCDLRKLVGHVCLHKKAKKSFYMTLDCFYCQGSPSVKMS